MVDMITADIITGILVIAILAPRREWRATQPGCARIDFPSFLEFLPLISEIKHSAAP
jgi:hypothetical protein